MRSKTFIVVSLLVLASMLLAACQPATTVPTVTPIANKAIRLNLSPGGDVPTLDPALATDTNSVQVLWETMMGLTRQDEVTNEVQPALATSWDISEDGFVYTGCDGPQLQVSMIDDPLEIRLMLLGWTPKVVPQLSNHCIELDILLETEKIEDQSRFPQLRYRRPVQEFVWYIMEEASMLFSDYGVFFTDESQDGKPWEGILENDPGKAWHFELAIITPSYASRYQPIQRDYFAREHQGQLWLARKLAWSKPPWDQ